MNQQFAWVLEVRPGYEDEYKKRHDEIWPELIALLKEAGISDYSIFLDDESEILFGVLWRESNNKMEDLPAHPVMQRWWAYMADIMETSPTKEPVVQRLSDLFHMP